MATGKTAVGHALAKKLKMKYLSTDSLIEKRAKSKISSIFKDKGELVFRDLETNILRSLGKTENAVIACGGGIILKSINRKLLKSLGKVFLLKAHPQVINKRLRSLKQRPLLNIREDKKRMAEIRKILKIRDKHYKQTADYIIDTTNLSINQAARKIIQLSLAS